jgi:ATP-dependent DNA helicase HFM1/MER3
VHGDHGRACRSAASWSLQVLCTTTTLALGVNLPAHLVVVKSTRRWTQNGGGGGASGYEEYDRASCLQMLGRCHISRIANYW